MPNTESIESFSIVRFATLESWTDIYAIYELVWFRVELRVGAINACVCVSVWVCLLLNN